MTKSFLPSKKLNTLFFPAIYLVLFFTFSQVHAQSFEQIPSKRFKNLYRLNHELYRSEQPSKKGMKELEALGIKTLVNLRRKKKDDKKARGKNLTLKVVPLKAATLNYEDIFEVLQLIRSAEKPVLVHCWHGSDRTGAIVAAYRMVIEDWPKEKAIEEFTDKRFGYHKKLYPNLAVLLESLDVKALKEKLRLSDTN